MKKMWWIQQQHGDVWVDYCGYGFNDRDEAERQFFFHNKQRHIGAGPQCHWRLVLRTDDVKLTTETP